MNTQDSSRYWFWKSKRTARKTHKLCVDDMLAFQIDTIFKNSFIMSLSMLMSIERYAAQFIDLNVFLRPYFIFLMNIAQWATFLDYKNVTWSILFLMISCFFFNRIFNGWLFEMFISVFVEKKNHLFSHPHRFEHQSNILQNVLSFILSVPEIFNYSIYFMR